MKKLKSYSCILVTLFLLLGSYDANAQSIEIECLNMELDGSMTLRVYGEGRNKRDAVSQAKKNAVYAVLFQGVRKGVEGAKQRPIVNVVNARERFADYFDSFFRDNGDYSDYVSMADRKWGTTMKISEGVQTKYCVTVRVLCSELRAKLKTDGIIQ